MKWLQNLFRKTKEALRDKCCEDENRGLFCLDSNIAFVKCLNCGAESMPWRVSGTSGDAWRKSNGHRLELLWEYVRKKKEET